MTVYDEIAAILHPLPEPGSIEPEEIYNDACWEVDTTRKEAALALEMGWDAQEAEPLLSAIAAARRRKEQAEEEIRLLVAYGREFTRPRPYTLAELAAAAGMSISGVRTAYDHGQVAAVAVAIGRPGRDWRADDPSDPPTGSLAP
ncbi:hypothetical protein [Streptosporangium sp. NPDC002524]|uniref:hypothetical protein n=1 Tax=Streptosporangium sp. NPDC002524 TaxID=3154537 RepID=UPI00332139B8